MATRTGGFSSTTGEDQATRLMEVLNSGGQDVYINSQGEAVPLSQAQIIQQKRILMGIKKRHSFGFGHGFPVFDPHHHQLEMERQMFEDANLSPKKLSARQSPPQPASPSKMSNTVGEVSEGSSVSGTRQKKELKA